MTRRFFSFHSTRLLPSSTLAFLGVLGLFGFNFLAVPALAQGHMGNSTLENSSPAKDEAPRTQGEKDRRKRQALKSFVEAEEINFDAEAAKKRDAQIQTLAKVIPKAHGQAKADLLFRLAELWWEKSQRASREAVASYDRALEAWLAAADERGDSLDGEPPALDDFLADSELFRHEALRTYGAILEGWPNYPRRDEVLFADAYNKAQLERKAEAAKGYRQLINEFPASRFTFDAQVQLGEIEFEAGHLGQAVSAYEQALKAPGTTLRTFARYRLAWCDFNAGDDVQGVARLKAVVEESGAHGLLNEAMSDLAAGFARLEDIQGAIDWFESQKRMGRIDETTSRQLIRKTASLLVKEGKSKAGRAGFEWLLGSNKWDARAPEDLNAVVDSYEAERDRENVLKSLFDLGRNYGPTSDWAQANAGNDSALQRAYQVAESAMRTLVADYHDEALRTKSAATYRIARDIYAEYLTLYPHSPSAPDLAFSHGEILWALMEYEAAGRQYALCFAKAPKGQHAQNAAYNAVLAYEKALAQEEKATAKPELSDDARVEEGAQKAALAKGHKQAILREISRRKASDSTETEQPKTQLSKLRTALILAIDQFAQAFPSDPEAVASRYRAAHLLVKSGDEVEAARRLGAIIGDFPQDPWSRKAVALALDLLEKRGAWLALHEEAKKFSASEILVHGDKAFQRRMSELSVAALYKHFDEVVLTDPNGGRLRAATGLEDLAKTHPDSQYAPQAAFHAMDLYEAEGNWVHSFEVGQMFLQNWPNASMEVGGILLAHEVERRMATQLFHRGKIAESESLFSRYLEALASDPGQATVGKAQDLTSDLPIADAQVTQALFLAATAAKALSETAEETPETTQWRQKAIQRFWQLARRTSPSSQSVQAQFSALSLEAKETPEKAAVQALKLLKTPTAEKSPPMVRLQWLSEVAHWLSQTMTSTTSTSGLLTEASQCAESIFRSLPEADQTSDEAKDVIGSLRFFLHEQAFSAAISIDFSEANASVRKLRSTLRDKVNRVGKLESAYLDLAALGSKKWSLAALTRLGQLYGDLAKKILESPDPQGLTDEELELYREALETQAFPLEEKAMDALGSAVEKAMELSAYGPWILEAQAALQELKPKVFLPIHDEKFHPLWAWPTLLSPSDSLPQNSSTPNGPGKGSDPK